MAKKETSVQEGKMITKVAKAFGKVGPFFSPTWEWVAGQTSGRFKERLTPDFTRSYELLDDSDLYGICLEFLCKRDFRNAKRVAFEAARIERDYDKRHARLAAASAALVRCSEFRSLEREVRDLILRSWTREREVVAGQAYHHFAAFSLYKTEKQECHRLTSAIETRLAFLEGNPSSDEMAARARPRD